MTTFALVHGGWHGAWCWERLAPLLQRAGHAVATMDLPCDDGTASFDTYADVVCAALEGYGDDVVLVGHSLGGHTIPLVASRRPVRRLVYLCAVVPDIGRSLFDQLQDASPPMNPDCRKGLERDGQKRRIWVDLSVARDLLYADCDEQTVEAALKRLRPQADHPQKYPLPLSEFPSVPCSYVVCTEDRMILPEWSKRVARDRIGADLIELPGSHSPMLSRPSVLADVLLGITDAS
jgi:pimeloyl-ACP methyl ester carboxylesterase